MIDLDDVALLCQYDRNGLLDRAAQTRTRLPNAHAIARDWAGDAHALPADPGMPIVICLPPEMAGIGQIVAALAAERGTKRPLLTRAGSEIDSFTSPTSPALTFYVAPGARLPGKRALGEDADSPIYDLPSALTGDLHPVESLLALLIFLDDIEAGNGSVHLPLEALRACQTDVPIAENPAKQLAIRLHERVPLFWGRGLYEGVAADWRMRYLWYAEQMALHTGEAELSRLLVMARFPRFWPNATLLLHLFRAGDASAESSAPKRLLARRRFTCADVTAPANVSSLTAACYLLELGEWVALYASALYNVDPADRVPLEWLASAI